MHGRNLKEMLVEPLVYERRQKDRKAAWDEDREKRLARGDPPPGRARARTSVSASASASPSPSGAAASARGPSNVPQEAIDIGDSPSLSAINTTSAPASAPPAPPAVLPRPPPSAA